MYHDELAFNRGCNLYLTWMRKLKKYSAETLASKLAARHREGTVVEAKYLANGSFNHCYRVKFESGPDAVVRFPAIGRASFRREMVENKVAVMEYLARHTSIPIPPVLGSGTCAVGPYIVMQYVEGDLLSKYLKAPATEMDYDTLNPDISEAVLRKAYYQMARILLALYRCQFPEIGAITRKAAGLWSVGKRALTFNMNELVSLGNLPPNKLSQCPFMSAADYFEALAQDHLSHLVFQRNDAVDDEADCRKKYIARCLFLKVARSFTSGAHEYGPFCLFCDDLRPSNVIVDADLNVRGVIDWDFCYAAPVEFTYSPPWWLLLAQPDGWERGLDDFWTLYLSRLKIFLEVLRECESQAIDQGALQESQRLSGRMSESMCSGAFWVCFAARSSYAFDEVYWRFVDPLYYGKLTSIEDRVHLLSAEEQAGLEELVVRKMKQAEECVLDTHQTLDEMINA